MRLSSRLLLFLVLVIVSTAAAETKIGTWSKEANRQWWADHPDPSRWPAEAESIHSQLLAIQDRLGMQKALSNRHFIGWMRHLKWLSLFPENVTPGSFFADSSSVKTFGSLALEEKIHPLILDSLSPHDDHQMVAEIACRLFAANPDLTRDYPALAVAFAIVFDQGFPDGWPHPFVDKADVLEGKRPPAERFAFYAKSAKEETLMLDPARLSPMELKFVVDTPVPLEELAHLQRIKLRSTRALEDLFPLIPYAQSRLTKSDYIWPHGPYKVFTIQNKGGLCVDQAYYTVHTAKARGIPSILFLGQGVSGAHAWLGYLQGYNDWAFDLAKFRNERYPVGRAFDPQTWRKLTDSECEFLNRNEVSPAARFKARNLMAWAELNPKEDFTRKLYQLARREAPAYVWAWDAEAAQLNRSDASLEEKMEFWKDWTRAFERQKDLAFRGQKRYLALLEESGKTSQFEQELEKLMRENRSKRFDLVIDVAAEQIFIRIENDDWDGAHETFLRSMVKLRSKAGGELFYRLVEPYITRCLESGKKALAVKAIEEAGKSFEARSGTILDRDLRELASLVRAKGG